MAAPWVVLARLVRRKVVWHLIGNHVPPFLVGLGMPVLKRFASKVALVAPSMAAYYRLKNHEYNLVWEPCWTKKDTETSREHLLQDFQVTADSTQEFWVVGVGHLVPAKNWPLWIEVAASLPNHYRFFIFGKEVQGHFKLVRMLHEMVELKNLTARLHISYDPHIRQKLHLFDVMLSTSKYEGTPLTLLEAQAQEIRVVARNTGGVADIIPAKSLVTGDNPEDFRKKIEEQQERPALNWQRHGMEAYLNAISDCFRTD